MVPIPRFAKVLLALIGIALLAVFGYLAYGYRNLKLQSEAAARTRAQLETKHQAQLVEYQRDLPIGTPRSEIRKYLDAHRIAYNEWRHGEIVATLGDEPDVGVCDSWRVYLSLEFVPQKESETSPLDRLAQISLKRIGKCL